MAEEEAQTSPGTAEALAKKKGKRNTMLALMTLPLVAALTFFLMGKFITPRFISSSTSESTQESDESEDEEDGGDDGENLVIWTLGTALANPSGSKGRQIMKVGVALELASDDIAKMAEKKREKLMDSLMMVLSSQTLDEVCSPAGKSELKEQLRQSFMLGLEVGPKDIRQVYFNEFVVQ